MCQFKSGRAVYVDESHVTLYTLRGNDSHTDIAETNGIRDDGRPLDRQIPLEYIPVGDVDIQHPNRSWKLIFDDAKPLWWTESHTEDVISQFISAIEAEWDDGVFNYNGYCDLSSLTSLTVPLTVGGSCDLRSLTSLTVPLTVGGSCYLSSLTSLTVPLTVGGYCDLRSLTSLTVPLTVGGSCYLRSLTSLPREMTCNIKGEIYYKEKEKK